MGITQNKANAGLDPLSCRRSLRFSEELSELGWYHSFELPDGSLIKGYQTTELLKKRYEDFALPDNLRGKRALDVGAWDGWFSFELEKHGAEVVAVDVVDMESFRTIHRLMESKVRYEIASVYELPSLRLGKFDIVLFLGVLYHLRHPLLALEILCELCNDVMLLDSFVVDGVEGSHIPSTMPWMEFYETDELGGQTDNWYGPSVDCLLAIVRAAGFVRPRLLNLWHRHARLVAHRRWEPQSFGDLDPGRKLKAATHHGNYGINFSSRRDEYLSCWFDLEEKALGRDDIMVEVGGYGANTIFLREESSGQWFSNSQLPRGLAAGWHEVKLRTKGSLVGGGVRIAVDIPTSCVSIEIVCGTVRGRKRDKQMTLEICCTVRGLSENADRANTCVFANGRQACVELVARTEREGNWIIRGRLPDWRWDKSGTEIGIVVEQHKIRSNCWQCVCLARAPDGSLSEPVAD